MHIFQFQLIFPPKLSQRLQKYQTVAGNSFEWLLFITEVFLDPCLFKQFSMFWATPHAFQFTAFISGTQYVLHWGTNYGWLCTTYVCVFASQWMQEYGLLVEVKNRTKRWQQ
jgi:glycopeptide antibiotics resistance protein